MHTTVEEYLLVDLGQQFHIQVGNKYDRAGGGHAPVKAAFFEMHKVVESCQHCLRKHVLAMKAAVATASMTPQEVEAIMRGPLRHECCVYSCKECEERRELCAECEAVGYMHWHSDHRACEACLADDVNECARARVLIGTCDQLSDNQRAMGELASNGVVPTVFAKLHCLKFFRNWIKRWWVYIAKAKAWISIAQLMTLYGYADGVVRRSMQAAVSWEALKSRHMLDDRLAIAICRSAVTSAIRKVQVVTDGDS
ncbi:hypothetical protein CYMTET_45451 [Cymbomonas tetramitiformis]|uniref:Uncharacterized protein n=1 Tax=Cymbomonas tetramitiformis TaxID=36881 RepID=A0AAE0EZP0_9CHLO|nr:hypothetical protein CYMTET_45451 [Cymbomonas tetramitiformis]